ncbi:MAG: polysaccharide biosynthesis/export family protein [Candidatus Margulisiibacteriota bacterium]|jgi:polysaccharide export outer membrane protein
MKRFIVFGLILSLVSPVFSQIDAVPNLDDGYLVGDNIDESVYKLAPGDGVEANLIVGENDLSLNYRFNIGPDGKIFFPKVGEILLLGKTIPDAKQTINEKIKSVYKEKYLFSFRLVQPRRVQIYLTGSEDKPLYVGEKKYVSVYGEVARAGRFEYIPGRNFSDYISYAGGPTQRANLSSSTITRKDKKFTVNGAGIIFNGNLKDDMAIEPGDVINVPAQFFYFTDFGSFSAMILTFVALYSTFLK